MSPAEAIIGLTKLVEQMAKILKENNRSINSLTERIEILEKRLRQAEKVTSPLQIIGGNSHVE